MTSNKLTKSLSISLQDPDDQGTQNSSVYSSDYNELHSANLVPIADSFLSPPSPLCLDESDKDQSDLHQYIFMEECVQDPFRDELQLFGFAASRHYPDTPFHSRDAQETIAIIQAVAWATENAFDESLIAANKTIDQHHHSSLFSLSSWIQIDQDCDSDDQAVEGLSTAAVLPVAPSTGTSVERLQRAVSLYDESSKIASFQKSPSLLQLYSREQTESNDLQLEESFASPQSCAENDNDDSSVVPIS